MANNVQCPNCGGYKIIEHKGCADQCFLHATAAVITFGLWIPLYLIILLIRPMEPPAGEHHYTCELCGYKWMWKEGTPLPKVNVNKNLVNLGAKKLKRDREMWDD